ncbi:uncharacterized protein LOC114733511 [Neltuma alba]|uniref:uncharacterized protein LOC114733511 n=1 Tax=Neltuma alba TaxID=207710 RepID=UPI0010A53134|nr:uncharacterized protein LOC114733511 [Prosopis alba]
MAELVDENGGWKMNGLKKWLPADILHKISGVLRPNSEEDEDRARWICTTHRQFSMADMYNLLKGYDSLCAKKMWDLIWSWKGPKRVQTFLWMAIDGGLLIAVKRSKILKIPANCLICLNVDEDVLHVLHDCVVAKEVYIELLRGKRCDEFFDLNLRKRFKQNLRRNKRECGEGKMAFAICIWFL